VSDDSVQVKFGAQIDGLVAGINEAKDQIEGITAPISGVVSAFQGLAEAAGVFFAVDKITAFTDRFAEAGEEISRTARITGESTDQIQLFNAAIKLSGGDAGSAAMTLAILQKNIGDAISKAGPARAAFLDMGISLEQLKNTDIVTLLFEMKKNLDEAGDSAATSALKMDDMRAVAGRQGAQFLALKGGIEEVKKVIDATGYSMSPEMTKHADDLADHNRILGMAFTGLANSISNEASTALVKFDERLTNALEGYTAFINYANAHGLGTALEVATMGAMVQGGAKGQNLNSGDAVNAAISGAGVGVGGLPSRTIHGPNADGGGGEDNTAEQIERNNYQTSLELDKLKLQNRKDTDAAMVASGQMSAMQEIGDLQELAAEEYGLSMKAVDELAGTYDEDSAEYAALMNKKKVLTQEYENERAKLAEQGAAAQRKQYEQELAPWKQLMGDMGGAFDTMINGILSGTQTWKGALGRAYDDLGIKFAEVMAKMTAEYLAFKATQTGTNTATGILGFGATNPFAALSGPGGSENGASNPLTAILTALTTAITGNTVAQTTMTAVSDASNAITQTTGTVVTGLSVATAANTTATIANTGAESGSGGAGIFGTIGKFLGFMDVGSWQVPSDGMAFLHANEMVVPAQQASAIRAGGTLGGSGGTASGSAVTININAIDTQTGASFLKNNASTIAQVIAGQSRNFNSNVPGWRG
jgi:hypothetical protein